MLAAGAVYAQKQFTMGTRLDTADLNESYVGSAAVNAPGVYGLTPAQMETNAIWHIIKITTNGIYHSGGDKDNFSTKWSDRASTNTVYK
jgi:hypothetical protein